MKESKMDWREIYRRRKKEGWKGNVERKKI